MWISFKRDLINTAQYQRIRVYNRDLVFVGWEDENAYCQYVVECASPEEAQQRLALITEGLAGGFRWLDCTKEGQL